MAFRQARIEIEWRGKGTEEKGSLGSLSSTLTSSSGLYIGDEIVEIDVCYFCTTEVESLIGHAKKGKGKTGVEAKSLELGHCQDVIWDLYSSLMNDDGYCTKLEGLSKSRALKFSRERCASEFMDIYGDVMKRPKLNSLRSNTD